MNAIDFMPTAHLRLMDKDLAYQRHLEKIKEKQTQHIKKPAHCQPESTIC